MKWLSVFILIVAFAVVGWALPAGAEKVRLTDDQMDNVSAGKGLWDGINLPFGGGGCLGPMCGLGSASLIIPTKFNPIHLGGEGSGHLMGPVDLRAEGSGHLDINPGGGTPGGIVMPSDLHLRFEIH